MSLWFNRGPGCDGNYVGIVNGGGYHASGSWEVRMGREGGCTAVGGGVVTGSNDVTWDHLAASQGGSLPPAPTDEWNHVVLTYDGTNVDFYLNSGGVDANTRDSGAIVVDSDGVNVGKAGRPGYVAGQGGSEYFRGLIDEVQ